MGDNNMGVRHMQGTPAFLEYIGPKYDLKRHSCMGCLEYFDGVCKTKKVSLDGYSDNNARVCKSYRVNKKVIQEYRDYYAEKYKSYNYNSNKKKNNKIKKTVVKKTVEEEPYYYK